MLSEDLVWDEFRQGSDWQSFDWKIISLVPCDRRGDVIGVVKLNGNEETIQVQLPFHALEELVHHTFAKRSFHA